MGEGKITEETVRREEGQGQNTQRRGARKDNGGDHRGVGKVIGNAVGVNFEFRQNSGQLEKI